MSVIYVQDNYKYNHVFRNLEYIHISPSLARAPKEKKNHKNY